MLPSELLQRNILTWQYISSVAITPVVFFMFDKLLLSQAFLLTYFLLKMKYEQAK